MRIREMTRRDVPAVRRIVRAGYEFLADEEGFSARQRRRLLEERCSAEWIGEHFMRCHSFVAISGDGIVGVVAVDGAEIAELFVAAPLRRRGIGARLFRKAEQVIADNGRPSLEVSTTGHAVRFYEAMGARVICNDLVIDGPLVGWRCTCLSKDLPKELGATPGKRRAISDHQHA